MSASPRAAPAVAPNRGSELLVAYLAEYELSYSAAGRLFKCARSYVSHLVRCRATPGIQLAARIEEATSGRIPCRAWTEDPES
jgi:hypothetical protein